MLEIKKLTKKFTSGLSSKTVLHEISLQLQNGSIGVLLGSSGTGKSTLLRIIAGLEKHDSGTVFFDADYLSPEKVGMVFQQFNLFENLTVTENITFALCKGRTKMPLAQATEIAQGLLKQYGMLELANRFPNDLSGGQQQRLAILRTIAQKPAVICFDEPTSALDPLLKTHIARTITELSQAGYTIVVATHDVQLVEQLPCTIFLMHAGTVVESAKSQDINEHPENFAQIKKFMYHS